MPPKIGFYNRVRPPPPKKRQASATLYGTWVFFLLFFIIFFSCYFWIFSWKTFMVKYTFTCMSKELLWLQNVPTPYRAKFVTRWRTTAIGPPEIWVESDSFEPTCNDVIKTQKIEKLNFWTLGHFRYARSYHSFLVISSKFF